MATSRSVILESAVPLSILCRAVILCLEHHLELMFSQHPNAALGCYAFIDNDSGKSRYLVDEMCLICGGETSICMNRLFPSLHGKRRICWIWAIHDFVQLICHRLAFRHEYWRLEQRKFAEDLCLLFRRLLKGMHPRDSLLSYAYLQFVTRASVIYHLVKGRTYLELWVAGF